MRRALLPTLVVLSLALSGPALGQAQSKAQRKCLAKLDKAVSKLAAAQAKQDQRCLKDAGKAAIPDGIFACTRDDPAGKVARAMAGLAASAEKRCAGEGLPDFGIPATGALQAGPPARSAELGVLEDLLSPSLRVAVASCASDAAACRCQQKVLRAADKLAAAERKVYGKCKKKALKGGAARAAVFDDPFAGDQFLNEVAVLSWNVLTGVVEYVGDHRDFSTSARGAATPAELASCVEDAGARGTLASEPKPVARARAKLAKQVARRCDGLAGHPLPGACVGLAGAALADCLGERVDCRVCFQIALSDGLDLDCDLFDDGQDDGSCPALSPLLQETIDIPSPAQPAETPGTPGVTVTNPKLLAQFGGDGFDLNRARYTRYAFRNPPSDPPDAILVLVPGFEGGAGGMKPLAENLLVRALVEHGQTLEVWAYDRRTNQLEDTEGLDIAENLLDPLVALDWLYGAELGLTLHPALAAGPNRRAEFYNDSDDIPFLASWTPLVFSRDIDAVVDAAAGAAANGNVFLGGHSAGTGFAARYAATDFDLSGAGPPQPGYAKLRGLVLLEGGGGSTLGAPPDAAALDRIEDRFDGGQFGAVRDAAPRCADGATPCTVATEATDCAGIGHATCTEPTGAYAVVAGLLNVRLLASSEPAAIQAIKDPDAGLVILRAEQDGIPGNSAIAQVPDLGTLGVLPPSTAQGGIGTFIDDDEFVAQQAFFVAHSVGEPGPTVNGLRTWHDLDDSTVFSADATPDNGLPPTDDDVPWGREREAVRLERLASVFFAGETNFVDWYFPSSGLAVTAGLQSLDSTPLSADAPAGRGRRDIENLNQAAAIDIPVIAFGGSNGLVPTPSGMVPLAESIAPCAAPSCDGTPRVVDAAMPSTAFPTLGGPAGGFEVYISEGYAHVDVIAADDLPGNEVVGPLADFIARNAQ